MFKKEGKKNPHIYLYFVVYRKIEGLEEDKNIKKKKKRKMANPVLNFETITLANKKNFISS